MTTSGTTIQAFQLDDVLSGVLEVCGVSNPGEAMQPEERATALKCLQLYAAECHAKFGQKIWQQERTNNLYTTIGGTARTTVLSGTARYYLDVDTEDMEPMTVHVRRSGDDTILRALSTEDFARLTDKSTRTGKTESYFLERNQTYTASNGNAWVGRLQITLYPEPDNSTDEIHHTRWRRTSDWGAGTTTPDVPWKYTEAYILGTASKAALRFGVSGRRHSTIMSQAAKAEETMQNDDTERAPTRMGVDLSGYYQI